MRARLQGGRFRWLNETLYTSDGAAALTMVQREPELMEQYHEGGLGGGQGGAGTGRVVQGAQEGARVQGSGLCKAGRLRWPAA